MTSTIEQVDVTLMFADIVGYSKLMGLNQSLTIAMVDDYRAILVKEIENFQGTIIEFIGDAVFARFATPRLGVEAAVAIQKAIFTYNHFRDKNLPQLHTRIGLHSGRVAQKGGALFGDDVNIAARLEPLAYIDGICISEAVFDGLGAERQWPTLALGVQPLKNIEARVKVWLLRPEGITLKTRLHYWNRTINRRLGAYRYAIAGLCALLLLAAWYFVPRILVPGYDANYVEIAEFESAMPEGSEWSYLHTGITEAVRSQLADMRDVYVLESGEGVQAPVLLEGNLQRLGDNIRIAYRLLRREGMVQIGGGKLDGKFEDIFILQDQVVNEIARHLASEFRLDNYFTAKIDYTADTAAYDYYLRGVDFLKRPNALENLDQAVKYFSTALVHDGEFAEAEAALCKTYWSQFLQDNDTQWVTKAKARCERALELKPGLPNAVESLGLIYYELGQTDEGVAMLRELLQHDPNNMTVANSLAYILGQSGRTAEAVAVMEAAISRQPKNWEGYFRLGYLYLTSGELDKAVAQYKAVLDITPSNSRAFNNLGSAYFWLGDFRKAANAFSRATEISPNANSFSNSGTMAYYAGDYATAVKMYREAIRLAPDRSMYYINLADAMRQNEGMTSSVITSYEKAMTVALDSLAVNNQDPVALWSLAVGHLNLGHPSRALPYIEKLNELRPNYSDGLYAKLLYEIAEKKFELAKETYQLLISTGYSAELVKKHPDLKNFYQQQIQQGRE